ncbi:MAG: hypothetical protein QM803_17920 [Rhodocyclaceae bacterium]
MSWDACTAASHQQIKAVSSQTEDGEARISVRHYSMVDGRLVIYSYECNASKSCNGGNGMSWNRQTRSLTLRESRLELFNSGGVQRIPLAEHLTGTLSY